ncbi:hypothetical protein [Marinobacter sp. HL-58]|uniref:hypothetical protein n=1 Tax=Marinobacter sp. HL-58 TaxID=1479237 RepID=UPI0006DABA22|nr:hypothetical protein [Marinobacter sp. HL-58]KPP97820.1 MAG: hypothetical protein HLUCCO03_09220 [Marinobacter sp. HL-58]
MGKCKNKTVLERQVSWLFLPLATVLAIAGCGGGSSGGGDGDDGGNGGNEGDDPPNVSTLSDSRQALAIAYSIAGQANTLPGQALAQSGSAAEDEQVGAMAQSKSVSTATTTEPYDNCSAVDDSVDPGFVAQEGNVIDLSEVDFPSPFTSSASVASGAADDARGRANCDVSQARVLGAYDIAQREDVDTYPNRRLVFAEAGGLGGDTLSFDDAPDPSRSLQLESPLAGLSIPVLRYRMYLCDGCVDGDLSDWLGTPGEDLTSVAFLEMDMEINGNQSYSRLGTLDDPFVLQAAQDSGGTGDIRLDINGEYEVRSSATQGCGVNATLSTEESGPLYVESLTADEVTPTSGGIDITPAGSEETYTVEFPSGGGEVLVNGQQASEDDLSAVAACGYVESTEEPEPEEAPDITGTWAMSECEQSDTDQWTSITYTFNSDGSGEATQEAFDSEACDTPENSDTQPFDYEVGEAVDNSPQSVQAYELDLFYDIGVEVYDLFGVDGSTLYLSDPAANPDEEQFRDDELFTDFGYERQ